MKNIHILPTDKPSKYLTNYMEQTMQWKNIYITSDEEIKEGDWCYYLNNLGGGNILCQAYKHSEDKRMLFDNGTHNREIGEGITPLIGECKKIILTTDQDLIKDGVQAISDEFLEWFVKNPSCEEVKLENHVLELGYNHYKIIIPKEEPKIETRKNRLLQELIDEVKNQQSFLRSVRKNPQLYYYKFGNCIYERLYNNNNCFEMQDSYGGQSSKMEQELISLRAEKIYYE